MTSLSAALPLASASVSGVPRVDEGKARQRQFLGLRRRPLIAAIIWWNSTYMADAVAHLRASGEAGPDELLPHTSPIGRKHIAFSGDFLWDRAAVLPEGRRELVLGRWVRGAA